MVMEDERQPLLVNKPYCYAETVYIYEQGHEQGVMSHKCDDRGNAKSVDKQSYSQAVGVHIYMYSKVAEKGNAS